jgi:LysM repeat protein
MKKVLTITAAVFLVQLLIVSISFAAPPISNSEVYYIVKQGDTLFSIGRQYGVSAQAIAYANGLQDQNQINLGQELFIPLGGGGGGDSEEPVGENESGSVQPSPVVYSQPEMFRENNITVAPPSTGAFDAVDGYVIITPPSGPASYRANYSGYYQPPVRYIVKFTVQAVYGEHPYPPRPTFYHAPYPRPGHCSNYGCW